MLYKLDESVGKVTKALQENGMLKNSIIVFTTDNGGPAAGFDRNHASNWPLKGVRIYTFNHQKHLIKANLLMNPFLHLPSTIWITRINNV